MAMKVRQQRARLLKQIGSVVVGGSYWVGFVIFLILVIVQFVVITSGAQRVAGSRGSFYLGCDAWKADGH